MTTDPNLLRILFDSAPEGVLVCNAAAPDNTVVYANRALEKLTGMSTIELHSRTPYFLKSDAEDDGAVRLRLAMSEGVGCHVVIRTARHDGTVFFDDITLVPLRNDAGELTHFATFHREGVGSVKPEPTAESDMLSTQSMLAYVRDDKLTGLLRKSYFEDLLARDWGMAQRESRRLTLVVFDMDFSMQYRDVFGKQGAEQCFRRIARVIAGCFRRSTDLCGRFDDDQVIALSMGTDHIDMTQFAEKILARVRDLAIHHPRSSVSRYVTVSSGIASMLPLPESNKEELIGAVLGALCRAKDLGRNRVVCAELKE
jgi:diguanylate cyclase (GGDEF)-like protein/PAS domain S-box-containing protein